MLGLKIENIICNTIFYFIFFFIIYFYIPNFLIKKFATLHFRGCRRWSRDQLFLSKKPAEITGAQKWWESRWKTTAQIVILSFSCTFALSWIIIMNLKLLFWRICSCACVGVRTVRVNCSCAMSEQKAKCVWIWEVLCP